MFGGVFRNKRVLVTGHTGFKGSWLSTWLLHLGAEVRGVSIDIPTSPSLFERAGLAGRLDHQVGDVRDLEFMIRAIADFKPDFVFHLAAQALVSRSYSDPIETLSTNIMGTANVLEVLRRACEDCVAVLITSDKCYDNIEIIWGYRENDALGGKDIYSGSKGGAELVFKSYVHSFAASFKARNIRLSTGRAGNVIGGGDWAKDRIVPDCIQAWMAGERVQIRSPAATRPWQHVLEPLSGYLRLAQRLQASSVYHGDSYNFGPKPEQNQTVTDLIGALGETWGHADVAESYEVTDNIPFQEAGLLRLNCDKALINLGWTPTLDYRACLEMTGGWYRRVLREQADPFELTMAHVAAYEARAVALGQSWAQ